MAVTTTTLLRNLPIAGLLCLLPLLVPMGAAATQFKVVWRVPDPSGESYNQWAERNRFQKDDSLLFVYPSDKDSVLQVSKADYDGCNTGNPIAKFTDGNSQFSFKKAGAFYFISGVPENCNKNEKMVVVVMADRSSGSSSPTPPPPAGGSSPPPSTAVMKVASIVGALGAALGSLVFLV